MSHFLVSINLTFKARHSLLIDELKCFIVCQFRLVQQKKIAHMLWGKKI